MASSGVPGSSSKAIGVATLLIGLFILGCGQFHLCRLADRDSGMDLHRGSDSGHPWVGANDCRFPKAVGISLGADEGFRLRSIAGTPDRAARGLRRP